MAEDAQPTPEKYRVIPPPLLFLICLGAAAILQHFEPLPIAGDPFETGLIAGGALIAVGAALGCWGILVLLMNRTSVEPGRVPKRVVTTGPFRFTRNPLYIALTMVAVGIALMVNSAWYVAGAAVMIVLIDRIVVRREEAAIRQEFGTEYEAYCGRVRRWL